MIKQHKITRKYDLRYFNWDISTLTSTEKKQKGPGSHRRRVPVRSCPPFCGFGQDAVLTERGEEQRDGEVPTDERPLLLHIHRDATRREITDNRPLVRDTNTSYVRWRSRRPLAARRLRLSARCAVMLALGCREAARRSSRWDWTEIVYEIDDSLTCMSGWLSLTVCIISSLFLSRYIAYISLQS